MSATGYSMERNYACQDMRFLIPDGSKATKSNLVGGPGNEVGWSDTRHRFILSRPVDEK